MKRHRYKIGWRSLRRVCPNLSKARAKTLAADLGAAMHHHHITTPRRAAMFIAQVAHESGEFIYREELASGAEYEGRHDLGNVKPGDGRKFKGRGWIQITGRANYYQVSKAFKVNFLRHPEKLGQDPYASKSAAWWWETHGCNQLSDQYARPEDRLLAVTRRINGGTNGLASRREYHDRARRVARYLVPR